MELQNVADLRSFLLTVIADSAADREDAALQIFLSQSSANRIATVVFQLRQVIDSAEISVTDLGSESNRWFDDSEQARIWLGTLLAGLTLSGSPPSNLVVKDSNGTRLSEADSVTVIKDLKVKGGSSDLKRGTLIKKIHLIDDPDVVECRADGSALVLKTIF